MPPVHPTGRPSRRPLIALLSAVVAVSMAARSQAPAGQPPAAAPTTIGPVTMIPAAAPQDTTRADSTQGDSVATDSLAVDSLALDSLALAAPPAPAAAPAEPPSWPVDPATGYTLINGIPVVGRAFVMQKTDGLVKVETVEQDRINEALPPEAPIAGSSYTPAPPTATRRFRGVMVQATLWSIDGKRSSVERRYFRPLAP